MAKKEVVNNEALTLRLSEAPLGSVENAASETMDTIEKTLDILEDGVERTERVVRNNPLVILGVAVVAAGAAGFIAWKIAEKRTTEKYEDILTQEIEAAKGFYKRMVKEGEFETPEGAVQALVPDEVVKAVNSYQGRDRAVPYNRPDDIPKEAPAPVEVEVEKAEITQNVFVDARTDPRDWDYNVEISAREANPDQPYVISFDEFVEGLPSQEQATLSYYVEDDTLADERDQPIDNTDYTVGDDNLLRFGHGSNDKNIVYVRNEKISMDFEIVRSHGSYSQEVLGIMPEPNLRHSHRRTPRRFRGTDE